MDQIILNQMQFYGYHGLLPEENKLGQRFYVDAELYVDLKKAGRSDNMNDSISYAIVYDRVKRIVEGKAMNLIEAVAETIAEDLLASFDLLQACSIQVTKPDAPIPGHLQSVAVKIYREKEHG
ncbi:dihydroneopterin aldolase [Ornithinibacillus sp. L9]|uniref:7,8-dihydroneopterin aldolase n=1 Tax=Ornithinibacillus caprae TaxID=2678566 RepID=A0A6N8FL71_9BACI|nr:dihydroneopterin aldolase [Ornithinibacillus caprae]MUK88048.1 dihydroneopterin aldolase [Ornithinibacillus caprae]